MSNTTSPVAGRRYGLTLVCKVFDLCRSAYYARRHQESTGLKKGPKSTVTDELLLERIQEDLKQSPFKGEGHRKVHARLKRSGIGVSRNRILRVMRNHNLLSPYRQPTKSSNPHEGKIITAGPNKMWGTDGVKVFTLRDGWVWGFPVIDHWNAECLGFHITKQGNRFSALVPLCEALKNRLGDTGHGIAKTCGLKLRCDNGSQYRSADFRNQLKHWGIETEYGFVRQPQTNGVVERFNRTFKEQVVHGAIFETIDALRQAVTAFVTEYNEKWLIGKLGYRSPSEAMEAWNAAHAA
jgi:putative transposase